MQFAGKDVGELSQQCFHISSEDFSGGLRRWSFWSLALFLLLSAMFGLVTCGTRWVFPNLVSSDARSQNFSTAFLYSSVGHSHSGNGIPPAEAAGAVF